MGGGVSVPLEVKDSIVKPGVMSVVSDPLECTYDAFCDELLKLLRYPVNPIHTAVLKDVKVVEGASADEFEVTVILDGPKLSSYGFGNPEKPETDRIAVMNKVNLDRKNRIINTENFKEMWVGETAELQIKTVAQFTKDPFQIDYYWELPDGTRMVDESVKVALQHVTNSVMAALSERKVVVKLDEGKKVFTCDPIDESVVAYDAFFDALIAILKEGPGELEEISETKFKKKLGDSPDALYNTISHAKDKGTVMLDTFSPDGTKKHSTTYYSVNKSPLTIDMHTETKEGERLLNLGQERMNQGLIDGVIKKATSGSGWGFGLF